MGNPKISIIIPHYNTPDLLEKLLKSIPVNDDIQTIVVDDNSTNNTELLSDLIKRNKHVAFYYNKTGKNSAGTCRNIGLEHAIGDWLLFADADDYFLNGWYNVVASFFHSEYQIVYFKPTSVILETGEIGSRHLMYSDKVDAYLCNASHENELLLRYGFASPCSKMIRKSLVEENTIRFEAIPVADDEWFSLMCGHYAERISCCKDTIYCITAHDNSLTTNRSKKFYDITQKVYIHKYGFLYRNLTPKELHVLGLDYAPLFMLYNTIFSGYGVRNAIAYRKLLRTENVPLVLWENVDLKDFFSRSCTALKNRVLKICFKN